MARVLSVLLAGTLGCGGSAEGIADAGVDSALSDFWFSAAPTVPRLRRGEEGTLGVSLVKTGWGPIGPVVVSLETPVPGLTVEPTTIGGEMSGRMTVRVAEDSPLYPEGVGFTLKAVSPLHTRFAETGITVPWPAGTLDAAYGDAGTVRITVDTDPTTNAVPRSIAPRFGGVLVGGALESIDGSAPSRGFVVDVRSDGLLEFLSSAPGDTRVLLEGPGSVVTAVAKQGGLLVWAVADRTGDFLIRSRRPTGELTDLEGTDLGGNDRLEALALGPSGNLYAAGTSVKDAAVELVVVRYDSEGALDRFFGVGGAARIEFPATSEVSASAIRVSQFRVYVLGTADARIVLGAFNQSGSLDATFGAGGLFVLPGTETPDRALSLEEAYPDLLVGGTSGPAETMVLAKVTSSGTLEPSFGAGGIARLDSFARSGKIGVAYYGDIYATGAEDTATGTELWLARFSADAVPDARFSDDGVVKTAIGARAGGTHVAVPFDGTNPAGLWDPITVVGTSDGDLILVRYFP